MAGVDKNSALANRVISGGRLNVARALTKLLRQANPLAPPQPASELNAIGNARPMRHSTAAAWHGRLDCIAACEPACLPDCLRA